MRNLKKILALALALVMVLSMATVANAAYSDAESVNAAYEEAVTVLSGMGVFEGYKDGTFQPQGNITRAEVAAIVYRLATGDVEDNNVKIHANYDVFSDVTYPRWEWAAGYIGYCANAEYIKGRGDGTFDPAGNVTGYEALAMILRAIGYDVNGEFTGEGWEVKVAAVATDLGLLKNVTKGSLADPATRELVAEVLFQAAAKAYLVNYTVAFGYQPIALATSGEAYTGIWGYTGIGDNTTYTTLGEKNFGLAYDYAYVIGNQGTHESATILAPTYDGMETYVDEDGDEYEVNVAVAFDVETDRSMFGHAVKVWHNIDTVGTGLVETYALYDKAVAHDVYAGYEWTVENVTAQLKKEGKLSSVNSGWELSTAYNTIGEGEDLESGIYVVVVNGKNDVVIVSADVTTDEVLAKNNFLKNKTVRFDAEGTMYQAQVEAGLEKAAVGNLVILEQIDGTTWASNAYQSTYVVDSVSYKSGSITDIDTKTNEITLKGGDTLEISPLAWYSASDLDVEDGKTYNFILDAKGCYIALGEAGNEYAELIATWMWYTVSGDSEDEYNYKVMGVDVNGEKVTYSIDMDTYAALLELGVKAKANVGIDTDEVTNGTAAVTLMNTGKVWTYVDETPVGFDIVDSTLEIVAGDELYGAEENFIIGEETTFYFVSGNSTSNLKVEKYEGTSALVGKGGTYELDSEKVNMISFYNIKSEDIVYGENYYVKTIVIVDSHVEVELGSIIYVAEGTAPGSVLNTAKQTRKLEVYVDGVKTTITVKDEQLQELGIDGEQSAAFYTYKIVGGVYVLDPAEEGKYVIGAEVTTISTIGSTVTLKADGEIYKVTKDAKIVTLDEAQDVIGENVNSFAEFVELAMQLVEAGTLESIQVDAAIGAGNTVSAVYVTYVEVAADAEA